MEQVYKDIYKNEISLPNTPLKILNCYIIKSKGDVLVIDTGFNDPGCEKAFLDGLRELSIDLKDVKLFVTHLHADHSGLCGSLYGKIKAIYKGGNDAKVAQDIREDWIEHINQLFDLNKYQIATNDHTGFRYSSKLPYEFISVYEGDTLTVGEYTLQAVETPGHTPGHMCLYEPNHKIMFTGDHILGKITPNIAFWGFENGDSLGNYLKSLRKIQKYDVKLTLPAHRFMRNTLSERVEELIKHHEVRLAEVVRILADGKEHSVSDVASRMTWDIKADNWEAFPVSQKLFASQEAMSHLSHLVALGQAKTHEDNRGILIFQKA